MSISKFDSCFQQELLSCYPNTSSRKTNCVEAQFPLVHFDNPCIGKVAAIPPRKLPIIQIHQWCAVYTLPDRQPYCSVGCAVHTVISYLAVTLNP